MGTGPRKQKAKPEKRELKKIVRLAGVNLDGTKPLFLALMGIRGIGHTMARAICEVSGLGLRVKLGSLTDQQIDKLERVIENPLKFGVPVWLVNRRWDRTTGRDAHLTGADLEMVQQFDIKRLISMRAWRGIRHMYGLPVRGQRTRSSFRKGRAVGVVRKKVRLRMEKEKKK
jgi:small subunit ribosomal protein S13